MALLKMYLKQRKYGFLLFSVCSLIFLLAFYLYSLPLGAALYPIAVCLILSLFFFLWDFGKARKKHRKLIELAGLPAELIRELPKADAPDDEEHQHRGGKCQQKMRPFYFQFHGDRRHVFLPFRFPGRIMLPANGRESTQKYKKYRFLFCRLCIFARA